MTIDDKTMVNNEAITLFLNDLRATDEETFLLMQSLRQTVAEICPNVSERIIYGGIMFSLQDDFGGVFPYKKHVSFEFAQGYLLDDPETLLEGKGRYRRHLKLRSIDEIAQKQVRNYVKQAVKRVANT